MDIPRMTRLFPNINPALSGSCPVEFHIVVIGIVLPKRAGSRVHSPEEKVEEVEDGHRVHRRLRLECFCFIAFRLQCDTLAAAAFFEFHAGGRVASVDSVHLDASARGLRIDLHSGARSGEKGGTIGQAAADACEH